MSLHTFNCLACHILANSEKLKLSKWRNSHSNMSSKVNTKIIQPISSVTDDSKLPIISTNENTQEVT